MLRERERERERMEEEEAEEIMHQGNPPIQVVAPREHNDNGDGRDHVDHQIPPHAPILLRALLNPSPTFSMLRTLHISGCMLFPSEARAVAGEGGQLPNLRNFRWTLWQPHSEAHPVGVVETLGTILGTYAFGSNLGGRTTMSTSLISNSSSSAPVASRQRKRKLRHVHAILHPLDQSLFYRKAPEFLIKDKRLRIDTCRSDQVDNNLIEMVRWWEFESGIVGVDEGSYSTDSFNVWMNRRMMGANGGMATINTPAIPMGNALAQAQAQGLVQAQVQGQIVNTFQHHHQQQRGAQGAAAAAPGGRNLGGNGHLDP
ncbi:hypothetical protein IE53DRAFT_372289 [Violaceomyces palustris]|uniref:Uncharacterized protein n=1 Tax=Violaceomyces palustris TaxID=1673888 RepID=A0ACD0NL82_9BASI|nr:hypothetical protein IE53DRAFT_372289 [Violaceomyces palustris]